IRARAPREAKGPSPPARRLARSYPLRAQGVVRQLDRKSMSLACHDENCLRDFVQNDSTQRPKSSQRSIVVKRASLRVYASAISAGGQAYSITSSARASKVGGMVRPRACLQVDRHLYLGRKFDGQVGRRGSVKNFLLERRGSLPAPYQIDTIANQPAGLHMLAVPVHGRNQVLRHQLCDLVAHAKRHRGFQYDGSINSFAREN